MRWVASVLLLVAVVAVLVQVGCAIAKSLRARGTDTSRRSSLAAVVMKQRAQRVASGCTADLHSAVSAVHRGVDQRDTFVVAVTFTNAALADFALNWLAHLAQTSLRGSTLVGVIGRHAEHALTGPLGVPAHGGQCFPLASALGEEEAKWGSPGFAHMGRRALINGMCH